MRNKLYSFVFPFVWFFFGLFHPWKAVGEVDIPEGGVLLCGNHTCMSDPLFVVLALGHKRQCRVLAKAELLRVPVLGPLLHRVGVIGVDRGKADVGAIKAAMKALKGGKNGF